MAKTLIAYPLAVIAIILVVYARVQSLHLTEGEALITGWKFYLGGICLIISSVYLAKCNPNKLRRPKWPTIKRP